MVRDAEMSTAERYPCARAVRAGEYRVVLCGGGRFAVESRDGGGDLRGAGALNIFYWFAARSSSIARRGERRGPSVGAVADQRGDRGGDAAVDRLTSSQ